MPDGLMTEEFKQYVSAAAKYCRDETFHGEYDLKFHFSDTPCPGEEDRKDICQAEVKINSIYLWCRLNVYPALFESYQGKDYKQVGKDILHEICHLFVEPVAHLFMWDACVSQQAGYAEVIERQTQRIANAIFELLPEGWYQPELLVQKTTAVSTLGASTIKAEG